MKIKRMSLESVKNKQAEVSLNLSETQKKFKEIESNKRKIQNLQEIVSDTSLDEDYRKSCAREVGRVRTEYYEQKRDIQYDMINLNSEITETKEEIDSNIENITGATSEIENVDGDKKGIIQKLKTKLKETSNGSLREWEYHKKRFDSYFEDMKKMKEELDKRDF